MSGLGRLVLICFLIVLFLAYGDAVWEYIMMGNQHFDIIKS